MFTEFWKLDSVFMYLFFLRCSVFRRIGLLVFSGHLKMFKILVESFVWFFVP